MNTWDLQFEDDCAVLDFGKRGRFAFFGDRVEATANGSSQVIQLDAIDSVVFMVPALPMILRPLWLLYAFRRVEFEWIPEDLVSGAEACAWQSWCDVGYVGPDRGWRRRETQVKDGKLMLGVDVHHVELRSRVEWWCASWSRRVTSQFWVERYLESPDLVSSGERYREWVSRIGRWPTRWAMDRAWKQVNGEAFAFSSGHYLGVVEWVGFFGLATFIATLAAACGLVLDDMGLVSVWVPAVAGVLMLPLFCAAVVVDRFRRTLDPALRPKRFRPIEEVRRVLRRLRRPR